jgi:hypothetical protein
MDKETEKAAKVHKGCRAIESERENRLKTEQRFSTRKALITLANCWSSHKQILMSSCGDHISE